MSAAACAPGGMGMEVRAHSAIARACARPVLQQCSAVREVRWLLSLGKFAANISHHLFHLIFSGYDGEDEEDFSV